MLACISDSYYQIDCIKKYNTQFIIIIYYYLISIINIMLSYYQNIKTLNISKTGQQQHAQAIQKSAIIIIIVIINNTKILLYFFITTETETRIQKRFSHVNFLPLLKTYATSSTLSKLQIISKNLNVNCKKYLTSLSAYLGPFPL